jgi:hypothetical protein
MNKTRKLNLTQCLEKLGPGGNPLLQRWTSQLKNKTRKTQSDSMFNARATPSERTQEDHSDSKRIRTSLQT